jgi:CRP-like cAMP-binding protein
MPTRKPSAALSSNRILAALSRKEYERLSIRLDSVALTLKQVLYEAGEPIPYIYFPENGVVSLVSVMDDGSAVEVATIGNEGMVGLPVFLGAVSTSGRAFSQIPGTAVRMKAAAFREEVGRVGRLSAVLNLYTQTLFEQIAQSAACNRVHAVEKRCARWLLMTHDRVEEDEFPLTQEFLAVMLGVRRATVTEAAGVLQRAGLIRYRRGKIRIENREGLLAAACECYRIICASYERLLGEPCVRRA